VRSRTSSLKDYDFTASLTFTAYGHIPIRQQIATPTQKFELHGVQIGHSISISFISAEHIL
jgi:hypothetical protein